MATFRRTESLEAVLDSLLKQSRPPSVVVIVDNDPDQSARQVALREREGATVVYQPVGWNSGPAGAWAAGIESLRKRSERGDWVCVVDDDDPVGNDAAMAALLAAAESSPSDVAAIGLRGAHLDRRRARLQRAAPRPGQAEPVDYLASGGLPLYRWQAINDIGFFNSALFFGFEDLDECLRLIAGGWRVMVLGRDDLHTVADTSSGGDPWRDYYKTRAIIWVLRKQVGRRAAWRATLRGALLGGAVNAARSRSILAWRARLLGAWDAWSDRLGVRRFHPASNPAKTLTPASDERAG